MLSRCANPSSPTGGPRDTIPPTLLSSTPIHKSLNFDGTRLVLTFDEPINADKLKSDLLITPAVDLSYTHLVKKNSLTIKLDEKLPDSTTFTFNFSTAITDVTERNPVENLTLAFSTGDYIDSLYVNGSIRDLMTQESVEDYSVGLYPFSDTLDYSQHKPLYFSKTNDEGQFLIENIKTGIFKIMAFKDENKNLLLESPTEPYAFKSGTIRLNTSIDSILMTSQLINAKKLSIDFARAFGRYFEIKFSKEVKNYTLRPLTESSNIPASNLVDDKSVLRLYNTINLLEPDSLGIIVTAQDTLVQNLTDTLYIKFTTSTRKPPTFSSTITTSSMGTNQYRIDINASKPIAYLYTDSLFHQYDTLINLPITDYEINSNEDSTSFSMVYQFDWQSYNDTIYSFRLSNIPDSIKSNPEFQYERQDFFKTKLRIPKAFLISVENDSSADKTLPISKLISEDLGIIKYSLQTEYPSYKVELYSSDEKTIKSVWNQPQYSFRNLPIQKYSIRVFIDANNNGIWESANLLTDKESEPIYLYPNVTDVKANWEILIDDISF